LAEMQQQMNQIEQVPHISQPLVDALALFEGDITLRRLLESLAEGVILVDGMGTILLANHRTEELFGYSRDEMVGRSLDILLPARLSDAHARHVAEFFKKPRVRPMGHGFDLTGRHKEGKELALEIGLSYLETDAGSLGLALVTDVSRRKEAEKALEQRNEDLDAYAHTVAHDLQASAALLVGYSEALMEDQETLPSEELRKHLAMISRAARKMSQIITSLLLFARVPKQEVRLVRLDMRFIVEEALARLEETIQETHAHVILPDSYPGAFGHPDWVEEVWLNYLSNALKYGGRPPRLEIGSSRQTGGHVKFWVKDNGPGLSQEQQAHLFSSSMCLQQRGTEGHGLGLSIVQRIAHKLNGQVAVESVIGQGSIFSFTLPGAD
jgi:PAS domain S-box-containing protein